MRNVVACISIIILLLSLSSCDKSESVTHKDEPMDMIKDNTAQEASINNKIHNEGEEMGEKIEEIEEDKSSDSKEENKKNTQGQNAEVIAKSNNDVSSKEKEEILNEIDKLLDDVFNNINEMDSLEDEDLILEN